MTFKDDAEVLRDAVIALATAAADSPAARRMFHRMLVAGLGEEAAEFSAEEADQRQFAARAFDGLAIICRATAEQLNRRADVTLIAEAFEECGDHLEALAVAVSFTAHPRRLAALDR